MLFELSLNVQTSGRDSGSTTTIEDVVKWKSGRSPKSVTIQQLVQAVDLMRQLDKEVKDALLRSKWAAERIQFDTITKHGLVISSDRIEEDTGFEFFHVNATLRIYKHKIVLLDSKSVPLEPKRGKVSSGAKCRAGGGYQPESGEKPLGDPPKAP